VAHAAALRRADPQVVGEEHAEDGDGLVVVGAGDGARDVAGHDGDEGGGDEAGAGGEELLGEQVGDEDGEGGEEGRQEDADVPDVHGEVEEVEQVVEEG